MANFTEMQTKMREQIQNVIENRMPKQEDKQSLPYIWAFIFDTLRFRILGPFGAPDCVLFDTKIAYYNILKYLIVLTFDWFTLRVPYVCHTPFDFISNLFLNYVGSLPADTNKAFSP